ncbi:MAG: hypothetical protein ACJAT2_000772 [Bacteriovoracaceae bacterium]|jgi:hypothetical protein
MKTKYLVCSYFKDDSKGPFVQDEHPLEEVDLPEVRSLLELPADYQFTDMYEIKEPHTEYFKRKFNLEFDLETYQYFFEAQA